MNFPTLLVGMANPERDAQIAAALGTDTVAGVAERLHLSRSTVRDAAARHRMRSEFDLYLEGPHTPPVRVCHVVCCKPFTAAALAAYRAYPGTLKKLELPGWSLTDGQRRCSIDDIRTALLSSARVEKQGANAVAQRRLARERLGMEA